eukprot:5056892-Alexandrium_andersonii.AAC.1
MVHVRMVAIPTDFADLPRALAVREALGGVSPRVRGLLRAQLCRVTRTLAVATDSGRRPGRDGAHVPRIDGAE